MKKYFKQLIAVIGSMALSIAILTTVTANAASVGQLIVGLTNPDGSPYTEPLTNPDGSPYEEEETYPPTECVDPYYLYDVVMCQPAIDATATTTYYLSFLPDDGDYNTVTIPNLPASEYPYEFKVHRSMWLMPADDWIGDENGNNIGFYKRTDGAVTIGYSESTDDIWVSGEGVEMVQVYHSLPDNSYNPTHPATYPVETTAPVEELTTSPAATEPVAVLKKGDADGNGSVTIADATTVQMAAAELIPLTDAQRTAADVNKDGKVDVRDATMIQQFLVELVPGFD